MEKLSPLYKNAYDIYLHIERIEQLKDSIGELGIYRLYYNLIATHRYRTDDVSNRFSTDVDAYKLRDFLCFIEPSTIEEYKQQQHLADKKRHMLDNFSNNRFSH
jgi:hypothetical protein